MRKIELRQKATKALFAILSFLVGAATSAILIHWARRRNSRSEYALPLMIEAALLLVFGLIGGPLTGKSITDELSLTLALLCFVMGLQNAMITKVSNAEIRTTHVTGLMTDIGIELGKLLYWNNASTHVTRESTGQLAPPAHSRDTGDGVFRGGRGRRAGFQACRLCLDRPAGPDARHHGGSSVCTGRNTLGPMSPGQPTNRSKVLSSWSIHRALSCTLAKLASKLLRAKV